MAVNLTTVANAAAQFLGVLDSGESLSAQQLTDALAAGNNMLDNWSSEGLFALSDTITSWPITFNVQSYAIGTGLIVNLARPVRIVAAEFTNTNGPGGGLEVVDEAKWASIPDRQSISFVPKFLFWDRGNPNGTVQLSPVPAGPLTGKIHTFVPLTQFPDTTTAIAVNPGYLRMIELGLAMELASQFDMAVPASVATLFADAAARVRKLNASLLGEVPEEAQK